MSIMTIYQADFFNISFPSLVDLIITSPPLSILHDNLHGLFKRIEKSLSPQGVFILECPAMYNKHNHNLNKYTVALREGGVDCSLRQSFSIPLYDFYREGGIDSLYFYSRVDLETLFKIGYRKCYEREMAHRCEFDEVLIQNLVGLFTEQFQTVLDPFCGTGTVPRTAHKLERNGIGIDKRCPYTNEFSTTNSQAH